MRLAVRQIDGRRARRRDGLGAGRQYTQVGQTNEDPVASSACALVEQLQTRQAAQQIVGRQICYHQELRRASGEENRLFIKVLQEPQRVTGGVPPGRLVRGAVRAGEESRAPCRWRPPPQRRENFIYDSGTEAET